MKALAVAFSLAALASSASARPATLRAALRAMPARDIGRFGRPGDPLNLVFVGRPDRIRQALQASGWTQVPPTVLASARAGLAELLDGQALRRFPPMNDYRVGGRVQDMNWASVVSPIVSRHHFRLWRSGLVDGRGRDIWWGSGNFDRSVRWLDLSHVPDPDMDAERAFIARGLALLPGASTRLEPAPQMPRRGINDKGYAFFNDGRALIVELR